MISIVTATYNSGHSLDDNIQSIRRQTYQNIQHIIVDGGSTDNTLKIIKANSKHISKHISEPDNGIYDALNKGIALCDGEIVGFLHSDDVYENDFVLEKIAERFKDPRVCAVYGDLVYVKQNDTKCVQRHWKSDTFEKRLLYYGWMPPHPTFYVRKEWYKLLNGFNKNYKISADYDSILKLFRHQEFQSVYIPETLVRMRLGGVSNKSFKNIACKIHEDWRALRTSDYNITQATIALLLKNLTKIKQLRNLI